MTLPVIGVDTFSLSRSSAYKELYFPRKILKPEVDVIEHLPLSLSFWWRLLLGLLVLRPSISSLLQSATSVITKCDTFFYHKVRWSVITKCDSFFITKCDKCYYKVRQVLQSVTILLQSATGITNCDNFITKCDRYYKVRRLLQSATVRVRGSGLWTNAFPDNTT